MRVVDGTGDGRQPSAWRGKWNNTLGAGIQTAQNPSVRNPRVQADSESAIPCCRKVPSQRAFYVGFWRVGSAFLLAVLGVRLGVSLGWAVGTHMNAQSHMNAHARTPMYARARMRMRCFVGLLLCALNCMCPHAPCPHSSLPLALGARLSEPGRQANAAGAFIATVDSGGRVLVESTTP